MYDGVEEEIPWILLYTTTCVFAKLLFINSTISL